MKHELDPPISDFMFPNPICMTQHTAAKDAAVRLQRTGQSMAVVLDDNGMPIGLVTIAQLMDIFLLPYVAKSSEVPLTALPISRLMRQTLDIALESQCLSELRPLLLSNSKYVTVLTREDGTVCGLLTEHEYASALRFLWDISKLQCDGIKTQPHRNSLAKLKTNFYTGKWAA